MMFSDCDTAILFFSLSPKIQAQHKQWKGVSPALARKTQSKLYHHTEGIIKKTGLPCIHSDENNQTGNDFGSKLSNALEHVFSLGYSSVIVLGNDCPKLNSTILESAYQKLKGKQMVLGPSQSGGVYLIGIQKAHFDKITFQNLPWQSENLQASLQEYLKKSSAETPLLPFLADLNRYQELYLFTGVKGLSRILLLVFQALIQCLRHQSYMNANLLPSIVATFSRPHRGPPAIC